MLTQCLLNEYSSASWVDQLISFLFILLGFFVCLFCLFFAMLQSPKACWELSAHYVSCFVGHFFYGEPKGAWGGRSVHGIVNTCLLYFSEF